MKATEVIKKIQDIIDKEQKDFEVKYQDSYGLYDIDDIIVANSIIIV